ncbi:XRE family transcriptional regulator [Leptospira fletcheri]|uniref:XRE family transcriptional regulator n=1 Tax=Leptospira fletcheri TaxID=2484981 RepID=A0A4R9GK98_9LEPT|nr:helix-turn-helix transcriptional regulator [Leptospira fletcheri]TGK14009.1 XRE family transcriptional regulator [Leptospira fletcheri]
MENEELLEWETEERSYLGSRPNLKYVYPGLFVRALRRIHGYSRKELSEKLGNVGVEYVTSLEKGTLMIGKDLARKLAEIFETSAEIFI